ncbi:phage tail tape measure protein [Arcicella sp. LKC2W]|uniref:phage tail tape measure protein n=1 Tax=Arcicella sp. LKC2W TaxID=2984198 RepID=UPI002B20B2DA|nr:phage tail tape measure protein [Arcicella sp. LKC2W]MEA5458708.1 phage tail tape measure protein [Arcicella sp. LKC2W]
MAIKTERLQLRVDIDTAEGVRNLTTLQEKYDLLIQKNKEAKGDEKSTFAKEALEAKAALDKERESLGLVGLTLKELKQLQRELNSEKNRYNEGTDQYNKANTNLNIVKTRIKELSSAQHSYNQELLQTVKTQGVEAISLTHLKEYYQLLQKEIRDTSDFESEANKKRIADSQNIAQMIAKKDGQISGTTSFFGQIKQQLPSAVAGAFGGMFVGLAGMASEAIIGAFSSAVDSIKKRARDITDIEVSLNTTREAATKIKGELNDIKTESSVDELKKLVVVAGDLNVAENDIKSFVIEADKVGMVLGPDFGGNVEEAITMIAKLKGEFRDTRDLNYSESLAKIGSTLKQLNLDGPASTQGITDFLKRVGAIPDSIKPTLPQLAAFGAVFEEANLSAEIAGSGFSKILTVAANNAALFGKQMGMTKKEIEALINTDPNSFVIKFAQSLKGLSGTDTAKTLKGVKLESDEVLKVVGILTDNIDKLTQKQQVANQTFEDGAVTTEIFNKYLNDEAGQISQIGKAWSRVGASIVNTLAKISGPTILWLANMTEKGKSAEETFFEQEKKSAKLEKTLAPLVTRYQQLSKDGNLSAEAHRELNNVIGQLGGIVPGAITAMDSLGRATKVNLGMINDFLDKNRELAKSTKNSAISQKNAQNNALGGEKKKILKEVSDGYSYDYNNLFAFREKKILNEEAILKRQNRLIEINNTLLANKKRVKEYSEDTPVNQPTTKTDTSDNEAKFSDKPKGKGKGNGDAEKRKREAEARAKFLQESQRQIAELQAKITFEELQAISDDEQKRINLVNKNAEDELIRIETQFKNQKGIVLKESELSQEQKDLIHRERLQIERKQEDEVLAIYDEFDKKRQAQILEQTNRAIQLVQDANAKQLQNKLKTAQKKGTDTDIYNAQEAIIFNNQEIALANLKIKNDKEKESLKDNKEALKLLEQNYGKEKSAIIAQYLGDWESLVNDYIHKDIERAKKANIDKLRLDVSEAELNNKNPNDAKIALLNAEMQSELSASNLTEAEKTNIVRRYAQERQKIQQDSTLATTQEAIAVFSQAYSTVSNAFRQNIANRTQDEQEHYDKGIRNLESQKDAGILTSRQLTKAKKIADKEHDDAQRKLKREQFQLDKDANIVQATINGVQAVMKGYAQTGPIGGALLAAIMGGITLAEIAIISSQKPPSYFDGGAMPSYFNNPVDNQGGGTIIAHPDEYMIPKFIRMSPAWANIEPLVEHARVTKQVPQSFQNAEPFYNGGAIFSKPITNQSNSNSMDEFFDKLDQRFEKMANDFEDKMKTPITAHANIGQEEIYKFEQEKGKMNDTVNSAYASTKTSLIK